MSDAGGETPRVLADATTAGYLNAAILALRQNVVPHLSSPEARIHADFITRILRMLGRRFARRGEDLRRLIEADRSIVEDIAALNGHAPAAEATPGAPAFSAIEQLEHLRFDTEMTLGSEIPALVEMARGDAANRGEALRILRRIVDAQRQFMTAQDPDASKGSEVWRQAGRVEEDLPAERAIGLGEDLGNASLTRHVQARFPGARVEDCAVLGGGLSKTTAMFTLVHESGEREALVLRQDLPEPFVSSVAFEFPLLRQLYAEGIPVAEPLWLDERNPFAAPMMVTRRVHGSADVSAWAGDARKRDAFARQLAGIFAALHALDVRRFGCAPAHAGLSAGELMRIEIDSVYEAFLRVRKDAHPIEEILIAWLKSAIPATLYARPASLVHGDNGFHNLMMDDGRVTALLDWEFAHFGDAIEDLVYLKPYIAGLMDWDVFKSYYRQCGGADCTAEEERFYALWAMARNRVRALQMSAIFTDKLPYDIRFAMSGVFGNYVELEAGETVMNLLSAPAPQQATPRADHSGEGT